jgi:hypothetical protein
MRPVGSRPVQKSAADIELTLPHPALDQFKIVPLVQLSSKTTLSFLQPKSLQGSLCMAVYQSMQRVRFSSEDGYKKFQMVFSICATT